MDNINKEGELREKLEKFISVKTGKYYWDIPKMFLMFILGIMLLALLYMFFSNPLSYFSLVGIILFSYPGWALMKKLKQTSFITVIRIPKGTDVDENGIRKISRDKRLGIFLFPYNLLSKDWDIDLNLSMYINGYSKLPVIIARSINWYKKVIRGSWLSELNEVERHKTVMVIEQTIDGYLEEMQKNTVLEQSKKIEGFKYARGLIKLLDTSTTGTDISSLEELFDKQDRIEKSDIQPEKEGVI